MLKALKKKLLGSKKGTSSENAEPQAAGRASKQPGSLAASSLAAAPAAAQPPAELQSPAAAEPAGPQNRPVSPSKRVTFASAPAEAAALAPLSAGGSSLAGPQSGPAPAAATEGSPTAAGAATAEPLGSPTVAASAAGATGRDSSAEVDAAELPSASAGEGSSQELSVGMPEPAAAEGTALTEGLGTGEAAGSGPPGVFLPATLAALPRCSLDYTHDYTDGCCDFGAGPLELGGEGGGASEGGMHGEGGEEGSVADLSLGGSCSTGQLSRGEGEEGKEDALIHLSGSDAELAARQAQQEGEQAQAQGVAEGCAGGGMPLSEALTAMVYLTEEEETGGGDALSVLSDGLTEDELAEELSELEQALSALEGEALMGGSPGMAGRSPGASLDKELKERLGLADDDDPAGYAKQMVKLYTNLGLKLMDSRKFDDALSMMHKAEAIVENDELWGAGTPNPTKRKRLQAITYNNLGCLFKRRNQPQLALQYLMRALALEEEIGHVQNSSSTHLNICAAYSSLKKYKESLAHAERAIVLLQRQLWSPTASFQDGLLQLTKVLSTAADKRLLSSVNVLAIAYHNAALEHERLGRVREAHVCFTRASTISIKCLGPRSALTNSLQRALKAFVSRHHQSRGRGTASATPRAGSSLGSAQVKVRQTSPKRGSTRSSLRPPSGTRSTSRSALAAASAKTTLPLDKSGRAFGKEVRAGSSGKLSSRG